MFFFVNYIFIFDTKQRERESEKIQNEREREREWERGVMGKKVIINKGQWTRFDNAIKKRKIKNK